MNDRAEHLKAVQAALVAVQEARSTSAETVAWKAVAQAVETAARTARLAADEEWLDELASLALGYYWPRG